MTEVVVLRARPGQDGETKLEAPFVGIFTAHTRPGEIMSPGQSVGTLEVLGVPRALQVPKGVTGRVTTVAGSGRARVPIQHGESLVLLSVVTDAGATSDASTADAPTTATLAFTAPMSGRFYSRASPTDPSFVVAGDTVVRGQTVGLLEVMKTFNRLVYQGDELPETAVVESVVPEDGDDVVRGDVLLALRPEGD